MSRFNRRRLRRVVLLISATVATALATALPALASSSGWMWE